MKETTNFAIPYPESTDPTTTWEYWQQQAEKLDAMWALWRGSIGTVALPTASTYVAGPLTAVYAVPAAWTVASTTVAVPFDGFYLLSLEGNFAYSGSAFGYVRLAKNGTTLKTVRGMADQLIVTTNTAIQCAAGDTITASFAASTAGSSVSSGTLIATLAAIDSATAVTTTDAELSKQAEAEAAALDQ